jgi:hypothetical protein
MQYCRYFCALLLATAYSISATSLLDKHGAAALATTRERQYVVEINQTSPISELVIGNNATVLITSTGLVDIWNTTVMKRHKMA